MKTSRTTPLTRSSESPRGVEDGEPIQIVPVFDLLGGVVVRGAGGERGSYRPVEVEGLDRGEVDGRAGQRVRCVARHLWLHSGATACYVADLDALQGGDLQRDAIGEIAQLPWEIWLDAGIDRLETLRRYRGLVGEHVSRWIVALESLAGPQQLVELGGALGDRGIFSIDLIGGQLRTPVAAWRSATVLEIAEQAVSAGFHALIVLDVRQVGMRSGVAVGDTVAAVARRWPAIELISGGGIRGPQDLERLRREGCRHALVATALYDGTLGRKAQ